MKKAQKNLGMEWIFAFAPVLIAVVFLIANHYVFYNLPAIIFILGSAVLSFFTIKSVKNPDRKKSSKIIISIVMSAIMLVWCLFSFWFISDKVWKASDDKALRLYSDIYYGEVLPSASEIKDADKINFFHFREDSIFPVESFTLMCTYKELEFDAKLSETTEKYSLSSKDIYEQYKEYDVYNITPDYDANDNYVLNDEFGYGKYSSYHLLINNDEHKIIYVAFASGERAGSDDFGEFLNRDCGWMYFKYIADCLNMTVCLFILFFKTHSTYSFKYVKIY